MSMLSESTGPIDLLKQIDKNIVLWNQYIPTYHEIRKNPSARTAMHNDPGVKFMRHGWWVVAGIITFIYLVGVYAP